MEKTEKQREVSEEGVVEHRWMRRQTVAICPVSRATSRGFVGHPLPKCWLPVVKALPQ